MAFFDAVRLFETDRIAAARDPDDLSRPPAEPPQRLVVVPVGAGKTRAAIDAVAKFVADAGAPWPRRVAYFVANHKLAAEVATRFTAATPRVRVAVVRGQAQPDPNAPGEMMCRRNDFMASARSEGADTEDICRGCRFRERRGAPATCGWRGQRPAAAAAQVVVFAGNATLEDAVPKWLRRDPIAALDTGDRVMTGQFDVVVVDEPVVDQLVHGLDRLDLAATSVSLAEIQDPAFLTGVGFTPTPAEDARIIDGLRCRAILQTLVAARGGAVAPGKITWGDLAAAGVPDAATVRALAAAAIGAKVEPAAWAETPSADDAARRRHNAVALRVWRLFKALATAFDVAGGHGLHEACPALVWDELRPPHGSVGTPVLAFRWVGEVHPDWDTSTLILDATAEEAIMRRWWSGLATTKLPAARPPLGAVRVRQVVDQSLGYSRLATLGLPFVAKVARFVEVEAARVRGHGRDGIDSLVIGPKSFVADLRRVWGGTPPPGIEVAHFGAIRGLDRWGGVAHLAVVSRPLPPISACEDFASVLSGREIVPARDWRRRPAVYVRSDGARATVPDVVPEHHDPLAEAYRRAVCDAELVQAVGRARIINRQALGGLKVDVLTNVPVDGLAVDELVTLADLLDGAASARVVLAARGVILPKGGKGIWQTAAALLVGDTSGSDALRVAESRRSTAAADDDKAIAEIEASSTWIDCAIGISGGRYATPARVRGASLSEAKATIDAAKALGIAAVVASGATAGGVDLVVEATSRRARPQSNIPFKKSLSKGDVRLRNNTEPASDGGPTSPSTMSPAAPVAPAPPLAPVAPPVGITIDRAKLAAFGRNLGLAPPTIRRTLDALRPIERRDGADAAARRGIDALIGEAVRRRVATPDAIRIAAARLAA